MLTKDQLNNYWQYCLSIERNLEKTLDFVDISFNNKTTYSFEYAKIIMLACSEIDMLCRLLCKAIDPSTDFDDTSTRSGDIKEYAKIILPKFPRITSFELSGLNGVKYKPFENWILNPYSSPEWWFAYNKVKHYRHVEFEKATQSNAFYSVAGMIVLNLYLRRLIDSSYPISPKLFFSDVFLQNAILCLDKELPDFM